MGFGYSFFDPCQNAFFGFLGLFGFGHNTSLVGGDF